MSVGSARRRKLEAALKKTRGELDAVRAERDRLASSDVGRNADRDVGTRDAPASGLAARVNELRGILAVLAPQSEEEQQRAREAADRALRATERVESLERQLGAARVREDQLTEQTVHDAGTLADLRAEISEFEGIEARIERFESERRAVEASAAELEHLRVRIEDLETQLQSEGEAAGLREDELATARARVEELEAARVATEAQIAELIEARDVAEVQRETALETLESHLSDLQRLRTHVAEARSSSETAEHELSDLREALEQTESERDAARAALESRVGDVQRLREKVTELQGQLGQPHDLDEEPAEGEPGGDPAADPASSAERDAADTIAVRIARVQERLEQTELRVRRALTTAEVAGGPGGLEPATGGIIDITGRDAERELERLRDEVTVLAERAVESDDARRRAEDELAAIRTTEAADAEEDPLPPAE